MKEFYESKEISLDGKKIWFRIRPKDKCYSKNLIIYFEPEENCWKINLELSDQFFRQDEIDILNKKLQPYCIKIGE